jgi:GTP-binding protein
MDVKFLISAFRESQYPPPEKPEIAFAGRSNVGKSSLINILFNRKGLARTSSRPGRTQSINFFSIDNRLYFVDLPGYGYARVPIKVNIRREPTSGDIQLLKWLKHYGIHAILVLTKADKVSRQQARTRPQLIGRLIEEISSTSPTVFSAKTRQGKEDLWKKIEEVIEA